MHEMRSVPVTTPSGAYEVRIGAGAIDRLGEVVRSVRESARVFVITDATVAELYSDRVRSSLEAADVAFDELILPPGETTKNWRQVGEVLEEMAVHGLSRQDLVIAFGGGVIGDLAGFCAASYMRGIDFIQVPTTLLAQVDSSVGGKTGVDLEAGKNLAGAFHQPKAVLADTDVLGTLSEPDWLSGLAEILKMAILEGEERLGSIERAMPSLRQRGTLAVSEAVEAAVRFKASVVAQDEREAGLRECLNLGHTYGHAVEVVRGYGSIAHGIAVGEGIRFVLRLGEAQGIVSSSFAERIRAILDAAGLVPLEGELDTDAVLEALTRDKKARDGQVRWVVPVAPGEWRVEAIALDVVKSTIGIRS